jgi:peptide/nickel transport system substrate-binding protein
MKARTLGLVSLLALVVALLAAGCGGGGDGGSADTGGEGGAQEGGILRLGTTNYIDSLNPFNYIEAQAYNSFIMIYPQLVQYTYEDGEYEFEGDWATSWETSKDGKTWTFKLHDGTKWSDGQPLTAEDAAWTINTTVEFADGPTAVAASALNFVKEARAVDPTTLEIEYESPVGNTLAQLEQFFVLPKHVYEPLAAGNGKGLKTFHPEQNLPMVSAGAYTIKEYEKKGTTVFIPDPNFWGPKSNAEAVAMTYYTNSDSMINDLRQGNLDWVDQIPWGAVDVLKEDPNIVVEEAPGAETTNITWNANPYKPTNRELLDPQVKKALSMCIDREKIIEVVFAGYADTVESIVGHISPLENPNLGPLEHNCAEGNRMLDELGYERGPDGIRVAPATTGEYAQEAHPMRYRIMQPTSLDFNGQRSFDVVQEGFAEAGVDVELWIGGDATAAYAIETGDPCDPAKNQGYDKFDIAMWDWVGYVDPDFMLSVSTKGQWCSWSDTGYDNPEYDRLYEEQGKAVDPEERRQIVYEMQQIVYDDFVYTQLTNHLALDAHRAEWDGFNLPLAGYSKTYYTAPHKVG